MTDDQAKAFREMLEQCFNPADKATPVAIVACAGLPILYPGDVIHQRRDGKLQITRVQELN